MSFPHLKPPGGGHAPGQQMGRTHSNAAEMAHAAAQKGRIMAAMGHARMPGAGLPAPAAQAGNFRQHISTASQALGGPPVAPQEVHSAIDRLTQAGHFNPTQGALLKAHNGPLVGPAGAKAMHAIGGEVMRHRASGAPAAPAAPLPPGLA